MANTKTVVLKLDKEDVYVNFTRLSYPTEQEAEASYLSKFVDLLNTDADTLSGDGVCIVIDNVLSVMQLSGNLYLINSKYCVDLDYNILGVLKDDLVKVGKVYFVKRNIKSIQILVNDSYIINHKKAYSKLSKYL